MFLVYKIRYGRDDGRNREAIFPHPVTEREAREWMRRNLSKSERLRASMLGGYSDHEPDGPRNKYRWDR